MFFSLWELTMWLGVTVLEVSFFMCYTVFVKILNNGLLSVCFTCLEEILLLPFIFDVATYRNGSCKMRKWIHTQSKKKSSAPICI